MLTTELTRSDVEDFLFDEAELLSAWRWDDWLALFVEGARYEIPTFDARHLDGRVAQFFISDDWPLLQARITRMKSKHAHAENPPSHTHRLISNVRHHVDDDGTVRVRANFIVHRVRDRIARPIRRPLRTRARCRRRCTAVPPPPCRVAHRAGPTRYTIELHPVTATMDERVTRTRS